MSHRIPFMFALFLVILAACSQRQSSEVEIDLLEATVLQLQNAMQTGELTAVAITNYYIERIERLDGELNSVVEINPDALSIAEQLDAERAAGNVRSALHGIPVLLKDNIDTADNMQTTAGSLALLEAPAPQQDAFLVQQLRNAGAIILGKTNLSEWANFRSTRSSSGWSARGGQTHNAYVLARTPCGSSAGSAVAVAANLSALAVGTETNGSLVCPAAHNNLVSIKPSLGLISRSGIIPIAHSQDTAGPMTRTVTDAALLLAAMVGADSADPITNNEVNAQPVDYTRHLHPDSLQGKRIGVLRSLFERNPRVATLMQAQLELLASSGAELIDIAINPPAEYSAATFQVLLYEFKHGVNAYLQRRGGPYQDLAALIDFNERNADVQMPYFGQEIFLQAQVKGDLNEEEYLQALRISKEWSGEKGIDAAMNEHQLDAIIAPTNGPGWLIDLLDGDTPSNNVSSSGLAAVSGYPNITVPVGFINERPIGLSFMGRAFTEPELLGMAFAFEQRTLARRAPVGR